MTAQENLSDTQATLEVDGTHWMVGMDGVPVLGAAKNSKHGSSSHSTRPGSSGSTGSKTRTTLPIEPTTLPMESLLAGTKVALDPSDPSSSKLGEITKKIGQMMYEKSKPLSTYQLPNAQDGPEVLEALQGWAKDYCNTLACNDLVRNVIDQLKSGCWVSADWCGVRPEAQAAKELSDYIHATHLDNVGGHLQFFQGTGFVFHRSQDKDQICSRVNSMIPEPWKSTHVEMDIMYRLQPGDYMMLKAIKQQWKHDSAVELGDIEEMWASVREKKAKAREIKTGNTNGMIAELMAACEGMSFRDAVPCDFHNGATCKVDPDPALMNNNQLTIWVATNLCDPFTSINKGLEYFGNGAIAYVVWMVSVLRKRPTHIICESSKLFDHGPTKKALDTEYEIQERVFDPSDLGEPNGRDHRIMVMSLKARVLLYSRFDDCLFEELFFRRLRATPDIFFDGSEAEQSATRQTMAAKREFEPLQEDGSNWPLEAVLDPFQRMYYSSYNYIRKRQKIESETCLIFNGSPKCDLCQISPVMPAISKGSSQILVKSDTVTAPRAMSHRERWVSMGWPLKEEEIGKISANCLVSEAFEVLSESSKMELISKCLHVKVLGSVLLYILALTGLKKEPATTTSEVVPVEDSLPEQVLPEMIEIADTQ